MPYMPYNALYTVAPDTVSRFGTDRLLYGTAFVIYGLLRYMALTQGESDGTIPANCCWVTSRC